MERGTIASVEQGGGTITRSGNNPVRFFADRIVGHDRRGLKAGEMVWFEIENVQDSQVAINIRKCN